MTRNTLSQILIKGQRLACAAILLVGLALIVSPVQVAHAATITVTTVADEFVGDGDCSLREAVVAANTNTAFDLCEAGVDDTDIINMPTGVTITLTIPGPGAASAGDLDINEGVTIVGLDAGATIDGSDPAYNDRIFDISTAVTVAMTNLTITGADISGENGAGIRIAGSAALTLEDSTVSNNAAPNGGGIANEGTLTLNSTTVSGNTAVVDGGGISNLGTMTATGSTTASNIAGNDGGGISSSGTLTVTNSTITSNDAGTNGDGGGISSSGTLTVTNSTITFNDAGTNGDGGGIFSSGTLTVTNSTIISNTVGTNGGGIFSSGTVTVTNSTIMSNTVGTNGEGGGISNLGTMTISGTTIASNSAGRNGGGVESDTVATTNSITNSTIHDNDANRHAGGIANDAGMLSLNNVTLAGNVADADLSDTGNGGGIAVLGGTVDIGNTIVGDNVDSSPTSTVAPDCSGTLNSLDYNLLENPAFCSFTGSTANSIVDEDPNLGPLQDNEGDTETRALLNGSPAIDAGNPALPGSGGGACEAADQRGVARPQGLVCDMGAYEAHDVQVSFSTATQTVAESVGTVTITAELTSTIGLDVTVPYTVSGTATGGGTDHDLANGNISITAGSLTGSVTFNVTNDTLDEPDETVIVTMGTPTNAFPGTTTVQTDTITDDDPLPTVTFSTATQTVAESVGTVTVTASLNTISSFTVTVPYTVSGTATGGGTDHNLADGNITITAGSLIGSVTFTVTNDSLTEPNETVIVTMGTPINAVKGTTTAQTITITDDDAIRIFLPLILKDAP